MSDFERRRNKKMIRNSPDKTTIINGSKWQRKDNAFYALDCIIAWVTRPERLKGAKGEVKQARRAAT